MTALRFEADGQFRIDEGCPTLEGTYAVSDDTLTFADVIADTTSCTIEPEMYVDLAVRVLSDGVSTFAIEANRLSIDRGDEGLRFRGTQD